MCRLVDAIASSIGTYKIRRIGMLLKSLTNLVGTV